MKNKFKILALLSSAVILQSCGGGSMLGTSDSDDYKLTPEVVTEDPTAARPSENAPVITTDGTNIVLANGAPILLRGANLPFGNNLLDNIDGVAAIAATGSNVVRLQLQADTNPANLEAAIIQIAEHGMVAELTLWDETLACDDNEQAFNDAITDVWLGEWRDILAQDRYQPFIMINLASGWGPKEIFNGYSSGYRSYIDSYKTAIRQMRNAGFNVPIVVSAPGCGADYFAFVSGRALELMAADEKDNLILSVHGYGSQWKTGAKAAEAMALMTEQDIPVVMSEFGGSGVGESPVRHKELMATAAGDYAADLSIDWLSDADKVGVAIPFEQAISVANSDIFFDIKVDDAYIDDGSMGFQVYLRDVNDSYANLVWKGAWAFEKGVWNTYKHSVKNASSFGWIDEGFDITAVTKIGVEIVANGKPVDVGGAIQIDNLKVVEGSGAIEMFSQDYEADVGGWVTGGSETVVSHQDGAVAIARAPGSGDVNLQLNGIGDSVDFSTEIEISARVLMPTAYEGSWLYFKFFNNEGDWVESSGLGGANFTYGEWTDVSVRATFPAGSDMVGLVIGSLGIADGVSITDSTDAILLDDLTFSTIATNDFELGVQFDGSFDVDAQGFAGFSWGDSSTVTANNGNLEMSVNDAGSARINVQKSNWDKEENLDLASEPLTIKTRIQVPASFAGVNYIFQVFLQDKDWSNHFTAIELSQDDFVPGEWKDISVDVEFPAEFARDGTPQHFGFDIAAEEGSSLGTTDPVLMEYFTIEGMVPVEKEEVVIDQIDFHYLSHFENLTVDIAEGGQVAEDLQLTILGFEERSAPFGWMAWSWFGNIQEEMAWDMTTDVADPEALTARGEEIVNGKGGIVETTPVAPEEEATEEAAAE